MVARVISQEDRQMIADSGKRNFARAEFRGREYTMPDIKSGQHLTRMELAAVAIVSLSVIIFAPHVAIAGVIACGVVGVASGIGAIILPKIHGNDVTIKNILGLISNGGDPGETLYGAALNAYLDGVEENTDSSANLLMDIFGKPETLINTARKHKCVGDLPKLLQGFRYEPRADSSSGDWGNKKIKMTLTPSENIAFKAGLENLDDRAQHRVHNLVEITLESTTTNQA